MPRFVAGPGGEADVLEAPRVWAAAAACVGRDVRSHAEVTISRFDKIEDGFAGVATADDVGLRLIRLAPTALPHTLSHEIAHAWYHSGNPVLNEGRAELVADCVAEQLGQDYAVIGGEYLILGCLPDLRTWDPWKDETLCARAAGYLAARRLFRVGARLVGREALLDPRLEHWNAVAKVLRTDPRGEDLADLVEAGPKALAGALDDEDLDGVLAFEEGLAGSDATRWDTDGDGWWDGAPVSRPDGAIPLRRGARGVCLPRVPAGTVSSVPIESGGRVGGVLNPRLDTDTVLFDHAIRFPDGWWTSPGGLWVRPAGATVDMVANPHCGQTTNVTFVTSLALDPSPADFAAAYEAVAPAVYGALGLRYGPTRVSHNPNARWVSVHCRSKDCELALPGKYYGARTMVALATQGAAFLAMTDAGHPDDLGAAGALALLRDQFPEALQPNLLGAVASEAAPIQKRVAACESGWPGIIERRCK